MLPQQLPTIRSAPADSVSPKRPRVWAVGGGKGGVGKSVLASNLAVALAEGQKTVALVDADLGGANLHTLFGIGPTRRSLSDFLTGSVRSLDELMTPTSVANLTVISGARPLLDVANPKYAQKLRLLRHLERLPVEHVVLDVGAGSSSNVLDLFLSSQIGILVCVPEATSIENSHHFLKATLLRALRLAEPRPRVQAIFRRLEKSNRHEALRNPRRLIQEVESIDGEVAGIFRERLSEMAFAVVVNRIDREDQKNLGPQVATGCEDVLGVSVTSIGSVELDPAVPRSINERCPAITRFPGCPFSVSVRRLAGVLDTSVREHVRRTT
jgi:flagellar biosynthesis protein FlhG